MNKVQLPLLLIIGSALLIVLNFIFTSDEMDTGFWLRILSSALLILAMFVTIRHHKKKKE